MDDEVERIKYALSLALQFVPLQSTVSSEQVDIELIHDLVSGKAAPWDELDRIRHRIRRIERLEALEGKDVDGV